MEQRRKSVSSRSPARPTGQHKPVVFPLHGCCPLPLRDDGRLDHFDWLRAIPKKDLLLFVSPFGDPIIHLTVSRSHFFSLFFLKKILQQMSVGRPTSLVTHITSITISHTIFSHVILTGCANPLVLINRLARRVSTALGFPRTLLVNSFTNSTIVKFAFNRLPPPPPPKKKKNKQNGPTSRS